MGCNIHLVAQVAGIGHTTDHGVRQPDIHAPDRTERHRRVRDILTGSLLQNLAGVGPGNLETDLAARDVRHRHTFLGCQVEEQAHVIVL